MEMIDGVPLPDLVRAAGATAVEAYLAADAKRRQTMLTDLQFREHQRQEAAKAATAAGADPVSARVSFTTAPAPAPTSPPPAATED